MSKSNYSDNSENPFKEYSNDELLKEYYKLIDEGNKVSRKIRSLNDELKKVSKEAEIGQRKLNYINKELNRRGI